MSPKVYALHLPKSLLIHVTLFYAIVYLYINVTIYMNVMCNQTCIYWEYMNKC